MQNSQHTNTSLTTDLQHNQNSQQCLSMGMPHSSSFPQKKYHSILPDLATGWRPKNAKIAAPILITYEDILTEHVFKIALNCINKLLYVGPRHDNSYKFHSLTQHGYYVKYGIKCEEVPEKLKKEMEEFGMKGSAGSRKGVFLGMNGNLEKQLLFQSNFQSGNLDLVIKASPTQYNLFLRPDTNTRGHMQWFYFRISNQNYPHKKIKLNICNNKKQGVLFTRGMKPFIYSKYLESTRGIKWKQSGQNVEYRRLSDKEDFVNFCRVEEIGGEVLEKYYCLSFQYEFQVGSDQVYFAYCPPFTYSEMKQHIHNLKKKSCQFNGVSVMEENLCTSLTGLQIPILTITDQSVEQSEKKCVVITGRFHPGQSNGSHVLKGFLDFLVSYDAEYLRKRIVFKIIPMVNPDGVVFGNFRTSLSGKDLNRKFKAKNDELFPQVVHLKNFVMRLKKQSKMKMLYFLDFHGHSMKKSVFLYGPQYDIWSTKFQKSKILPKIISSKTNMFRYQSCLFRVAATKKTTARAFMLGLIPYCYTIQSSVGLFRSNHFKQNFTFDPIKWEEMGRIIADSLKQAVVKMEKQIQGLAKKKKKSLQPEEIQHNKQNFNKIFNDLQPKQKQSIQTQKAKQQQKQNQKQIQKSRSRDGLRQKLLKQKQKQKLKKQPQQKQQQKQPDSLDLKRSSSSRSARQRNAIQLSPLIQTNKSIKTPVLDSSLSQAQGPVVGPGSGLGLVLGLACPQINEVDGQSDGYSQGKSDCQSDDNDFDREEYKKISGKIMKFIQNFNVSIVGQRRKKFRLRNKKKVVSTISTSKAKYFIGLHKPSIEDMRMVPSLKHKIIRRQNSQKKITVQQRQDSAIKTKKLSLYKFEEEKKIK